MLINFLLLVFGFAVIKISIDYICLVRAGDENLDTTTPEIIRSHYIYASITTVLGVGLVGIPVAHYYTTSNQPLGKAVVFVILMGLAFLAVYGFYKISTAKVVNYDFSKHRIND